MKNDKNNQTSDNEEEVQTPEDPQGCPSDTAEEEGFDGLTYGWEMTGIPTCWRTMDFRESLQHHVCLSYIAATNISKYMEFFGVAQVEWEWEPEPSIEMKARQLLRQFGLIE